MDQKRLLELAGVEPATDVKHEVLMEVITSTTASTEDFLKDLLRLTKGGKEVTVTVKTGHKNPKYEGKILTYAFK